MPQSKLCKTRQTVDVVAIERAVQDVIKNKTKVRTATHDFGISRTTLSHYLMRFQEQENPFNFEHTARNDVKVFSATQELELVEYFKQAATLHYGLMKNEALKLAFQYGKANAVVPNSWENNESAESVAEGTEEMSRVFVFEKT
jgi:hypothetical protein